MAKLSIDVNPHELEDKSFVKYSDYNLVTK